MADRRRAVWRVAVVCLSAAALAVLSIVGIRVVFAHHLGAGSDTGKASGPIAGDPGKIHPSLVTSLHVSSHGLALLALAPDGRTLVIRLGTGVVQLWNTATGTVRATLGPAEQGWPSLAVSPDGREIAIGIPASLFRSTVEEINTATGKVTASVPVDERVIWSVAFSPDGKTLAIAAGRQLILWNPAASTTVTVPTFGMNSPMEGDAIYVSFTGHGKSLAVGNGEGDFTLLNVPATGFTGSATAPKAAETSAFWQQALSPDGKLLAVGDGTGAIRLWEMATGKLIATMHAPSISSAVAAVAFSPDGRSLVTAEFISSPFGRGTFTIQLWRLY